MGDVGGLVDQILDQMHDMPLKLAQTVLYDVRHGSRDDVPAGNVNQKEDPPADLQAASNVKNMMMDPLGMSREVKKMQFVWLVMRGLRQMQKR